MSKVFVLDTRKQPLNPVHPGRARTLLSEGKAAVFRRYPFTIILKQSVPNPEVQPLRLKIDPGAKTTGMAIVNDTTGEVVWAGELTHRGFQIRDSLTSRRGIRRGRRNRHTRYRPKRFDNRRRHKGWLPPSLQSRVENILTWVGRLCRLCPINALSQELVRFDTQLMQDANISGIQYQQGTLHGYELREYLLEKWQRKCAYCQVKDVPLQVEHIVPRSKGGSNRVSNLCLACELCNQKKGNTDVRDFLSGSPDEREGFKNEGSRQHRSLMPPTDNSTHGCPHFYASVVDLASQILAQAQKPLAGTAAVNATRWALNLRLEATELPVEVGTGGRTKFNRTFQGLEKTHWIDAACVGASTPEKLVVSGIKPIQIAAKGHGTRQQCRTDKHGFPIRHCSRLKFHFGFQTGDIVKAVVTKGKKIGVYVGRIATRATGSFNISTNTDLVQGISHKYCKPIHRKDGYAYL